MWVILFMCVAFWWFVVTVIVIEDKVKDKGQDEEPPS